MSRGIEILITHPNLDDLTVATPTEVKMTEDAHVALVDAVAALGYELSDVVVVELDDDELEAESNDDPHDDLAVPTNTVSLGGAVEMGGSV